MLRNYPDFKDKLGVQDGKTFNPFSPALKQVFKKLMKDGDNLGDKSLQKSSKMARDEGGCHQKKTT